MTLLIIDDEEKLCQAIKRLFRNDPFDVVCAIDGKEGLVKLRELNPEVVITDYNMPNMTGLEFIKAAKALYPEIPIIVLTAYGDKPTSVRFLKEGAFRYLEKPFDLEELKLTVEAARKRFSLIKENEKLQNLLDLQEEFPTIVGESQAMKELSYLIEQVAKTDATVLLDGESGTGKTLIARIIHEKSSRKGKPLVQFNCAAFNESLIESELFGHEKGAFTGAEKTKLGRFELAQGGTIFLDEIGELNLNMQVKLLRVLQENEYERVGGTTTLKTNARIIAATNQDLTEMVKNKKFREDLFFRLNVFPITVPPLRDRREDIIPLANFFLQEVSKQYKKHIKGFSSGAVSMIESYPWKGNVRELRNIISRAIIISPTDMVTEDTLELLQKEAVPDFIKEAVNKEMTEADLVKRFAKEVYEKCHYNKKETARILDINFRTLNNRLSD
ncbi:sigma-54-dependent transcriptional regulator [Thermoproteota archaeon]